MSLVFNIAKGRVADLYNRVKANDPANSVLTIIAVNCPNPTTIQDLDTLALVLADASTDEVTNTNYVRKKFTDSDLAAMVPDDVNNRMDLDMPDITWTNIVAGVAWTHILISYNPDTTADPHDSALIPLTLHDFAVTPDGTDITVQVDPAGFFRAS